MPNFPIFTIPFYRNMVAEYSEIEEALPFSKIKQLAIHKPKWYCELNTSFDPSAKSAILQEWMKVVLNKFYPYFKEFIQVTYNDPANGSFRFQSPWVNLYGKGHFQEWHNHIPINHIADQPIMFSYCYFHTLPDHEDAGQFIFRSKNMELEFGYPVKYRLQKDFNPRAKEHELFVFPSWIDHMVTPNRTSLKRITISGNFSYS